MSLPCVEWRGPMDAPLVLLLHGFMGVPDDWMAAASSLTGYRVGFVRLAAMPSEELAKRLWLRCQRPSVLAGYSMGGRLAIYLGTRHPDWFPRLVVLSGSAGLEEEALRKARREADSALACRLLKMGSDAEFLDFLRGEWRAQDIFCSPEGSEAAVDLEQKLLARAALEREDLADQLGFWGQGVLPSSWHLLPDYPGDVLLLTGENDNKYRRIAQRMAIFFRSASLKTCKNAGHDLLLDAPLEVADHVAKFLANGQSNMERVAQTTLRSVCSAPCS